MSIARHDASAEDAARYSAPALEKGLDILEHLSSTRAALNLGELADALGRTRSEIFRMVAVLEARGYLDREGQTASSSPTSCFASVSTGHCTVR